MVLKNNRNKKNPGEKCAVGSLQEAALTHVRAITRYRKRGPWEKKTRIVAGTGLSPNNSSFLAALYGRPRQLKSCLYSWLSLTLV